MTVKTRDGRTWQARHEPSPALRLYIPAALQLQTKELATSGDSAPWTHGQGSPRGLARALAWVRAPNEEMAQYGTG
jgi:hypothetical protein